MEERIAIIDLPEGIYKITLREHFENGFMYGYFAKGEQYEAQAETLGLRPVRSSMPDAHETYDLRGHKIPTNTAPKGHIFIVGGKKYVK